jgi:quinolinate synthase
MEYCSANEAWFPVGADVERLVERIGKLKKERRAIILAHNYQRPEVQGVADYVGDSVELSRRAMEEKDAEIILFSAVDFMAETAAVLNPDKRVLLPSLGAKCPMAAMLPADLIKVWRRKFSKVLLVLYVNTSAEAKAECDICCTSANAVEVVESLGKDKVLFGPDHNLAWHVERETDRRVEAIPVPREGFCPTHELFLEEDLLRVRKKNPDAPLLIHPECRSEIQLMADFVGSTSQIIRYVKESAERKFIIGTEVGIIHRLKKENPKKVFIPAYEGAICSSMKLNTLEHIYTSLRDEKHVVVVPNAVANKARRALERMFSVMGEANKP